MNNWKRELRKQIHSQEYEKKLKYFEINLTKEGQDLHKDFERNERRSEYIERHSWIGSVLSRYQFYN